jgi:hypothetical protein
MRVFAEWMGVKLSRKGTLIFAPWSPPDPTNPVDAGVFKCDRLTEADLPVGSSTRAQMETILFAANKAIAHGTIQLDHDLRNPQQTGDAIRLFVELVKMRIYRSNGWTYPEKLY